MELFLFVVFSLITLVSAAAVVMHPHPVKSALFLIVSFFAMGGLYLLMQAEFIALMQVLVYAGAVMVLFLFVIMLVNLEAAARERQFHRGWLGGVLCAAGTGAVLVWMWLRGVDTLRLPPSVQPTPREGGNVESLAMVLFRDYLVPFELASLLLLVAIVGGVMMAKKRI